ncbi:MAG: hypothetical protein HOG49_06495 [Candidatus Scalindua sp.]|jgi:hypothetical protein|nr:hypothetical protein [Candidatus Scalindua sp.]
MTKKDCKKCVFDEEGCILCTFVNEKSISGKQPKLKFYSAEFHDNALQRLKDIHLDI